MSANYKIMLKETLIKYVFYNKLASGKIFLHSLSISLLNVFNSFFKCLLQRHRKLIFRLTGKAKV